MNKAVSVSRSVIVGFATVFVGAILAMPQCTLAATASDSSAVRMARLTVFRREARYAEAAALARGLLASIREDSSARPHQLVTAEWLLRTLVDRLGGDLLLRASAGRSRPGTVLTEGASAALSSRRGQESRGCPGLRDAGRSGGGAPGRQWPPSR
jgi:hypothetical protein